MIAFSPRTDLKCGKVNDCKVFLGKKLLGESLWMDMFSSSTGKLARGYTDGELVKESSSAGVRFLVETVPRESIRLVVAFDGVSKLK